MAEQNKNGLPKGWVWTKLSEILGFAKGKKPFNLGDRNPERLHAYINIKAFEKRIYDEYTNGKGCPECTKEDLLIVWDGARCGLVGRGSEGIIGSTLAKLPYNSLNGSYVYNFLQSKYELINKRPRGVGIPHVEPNLFWNIDFPLPPLPEQQRIVAKIEELFTDLDAGVGALRQIQVQLKRYRQAVFKVAFEGKLTAEWRMKNDECGIESGKKLLERIQEERRHSWKRQKYKEPKNPDTINLPLLPKSWLWVRAEQLCDFITKGTTPSAINMKQDNGEIPFVKIYNLTKTGILDFSKNPTFVSKETHRTQLVRSKVIPGDVLMNLVGPPLGKVSIVPDTYPEWNLNQAIAIFRPMSGYNRKFLMYALLTDHILSWALNRSKATAGQHNLTLEISRDLPLPLPPFDEQQQVVSEIERLFSVADAIEKTVEESLVQSERLRQSILKKAFEGKLVQQDPTDPPASELLEQIKKERVLAIEAKEESKNKRSSAYTSFQRTSRRAGEPAEKLLERIKVEREKENKEEAQKNSSRRKK